MCLGCPHPTQQCSQQAVHVSPLVVALCAACYCTPQQVERATGAVFWPACASLMRNAPAGVPPPPSCRVAAPARALPAGGYNWNLRPRGISALVNLEGNVGIHRRDRARRSIRDSSLGNICWYCVRPVKLRSDTLTSLDADRSGLFWDKLKSIRASVKILADPLYDVR